MSESYQNLCAEHGPSEDWSREIWEDLMHDIIDRICDGNMQTIWVSNQIRAKQVPIEVSPDIAEDIGRLPDLVKISLGDLI